MPKEESIGSIYGNRAVELAKKNGELTGVAAKGLVNDLANAVMEAQGVAGFTLENMINVVKATMAESMTPEAIRRMTEPKGDKNTDLPQGWFFAHGSNKNNLKIGDVKVTLGTGENAIADVTMNIDTQATMFTGGGGDGFMGAFFENMVLGFPINSISGPDLRLELERRNITDQLIKSLAPEMKGISDDSFNVGKATLQVREAFDMAKRGTSIYTVKPDSWKNVGNRITRKEDERKKAKEAGEKIEKNLKAGVEVVIDPFVAMVVGLAELFHKLMALLLIETVAHDKSPKKAPVEWFLFEYLSAWLFFKLDVKKLLDRFNIKEDNASELFKVRARVELVTPSEADFLKGTFKMGNVKLQVDVNIARGLHAGFDTSIFLEEKNLFVQETRAEFFRGMAELQKEHKLLAIQRGDMTAREAFGIET